MYKICHHSGRVLFTTHNEVTAHNREQFGWKVIEVDKSREQFEYEAGQVLNLPISIIELARKGDGYDHAFDSMNIMQPLNGWWHWWKKSRAAIEIELPDSTEFDGPDMSGAQQAISQIREKLTETGIKVKE